MSDLGPVLTLEPGIVASSLAWVLFVALGVLLLMGVRIRRSETSQHRGGPSIGALGGGVIRETAVEVLVSGRPCERGSKQDRGRVRKRRPWCWLVSWPDGGLGGAA